MKVIKKAAAKAVKAIIGTFVAIGSRGVVVTELDKIEAPLVIGSQPVLTKSREDGDHWKKLWVASCSWITSTKAVDKIVAGVRRPSEKVKAKP